MGPNTCQGEQKPDLDPNLSIAPFYIIYYVFRFVVRIKVRQPKSTQDAIFFNDLIKSIK